MKRLKTNLNVVICTFKYISSIYFPIPTKFANQNNSKGEESLLVTNSWRKWNVLRSFFVSCQYSRRNDEEPVDIFIIELKSVSKINLKDVSILYCLLQYSPIYIYIFCSKRLSLVASFQKYCYVLEY